MFPGWGGSGGETSRATKMTNQEAFHIPTAAIAMNYPITHVSWCFNGLQPCGPPGGTNDAAYGPPNFVVVFKIYSYCGFRSTDPATVPIPVIDGNTDMELDGNHKTVYWYPTAAAYNASTETDKCQGACGYISLSSALELTAGNSISVTIQGIGGTYAWSQGGMDFACANYFAGWRGSFSVGVGFTK